MLEAGPALEVAGLQIVLGESPYVQHASGGGGEGLSAHNLVINFPESREDPLGPQPSCLDPRLHLSQRIWDRRDRQTGPLH